MPVSHCPPSDMDTYRHPMSSDPHTMWLRSMRRRNLAPGTIAHRASAARMLTAHAGVPLLEVTTEQIEAWLDSRKVSARTRYVNISHIAAFFKWATREELCVVDPTLRIDRPKYRQSIPRPIALHDLRVAIAQSPTLEITAMLMLGAFAGLRCAEMAALDFGDINGDRMLVHGKGGKDRIVPIHPLVQQSIVPLRHNTTGSVLGDLKPWQVSHRLSKHFERCGIIASGHQLRHFFGTAAYEASGHDLRMVQELLGHSSPNTTAMYTQWASSRAGDVVASMTA